MSMESLLNVSIQAFKFLKSDSPGGATDHTVNSYIYEVFTELIITQAIVNY